MRIAIIGGGKVGRVLGRLARERGHKIQQVVCRSKRSAMAAVRFIGAGVPQGARTARLSICDLVIIATPDDHLAEAVSVVQRSERPAKNAVVLHTSGAVTSEILEPAREAGFSIGSCHPLQTFESPARGLALVQGTFFCIEGDRWAASVAGRLVSQIGGRHFTIPRECKGLYHASAVLACGGVTSLISISIELLVACGLGDAKALRVLLPLVEGTVENIKRTGPVRALTGPVRRGDEGTVGLNLRALEKVNDRWVRLYSLLAIQAIQLARRAGVKEADLDRVDRLLKKSSR